MSGTIVITGTGTSTGTATVERFASAGWTVLATIRNEADLGAYGRLAEVHPLRLDETAPEPLAAQADAQLGPVVAVVNHTNERPIGPLEPWRASQVHSSLSGNLLELVAMSWAFLPGMRARGHGHIINVTTITTARGYPGSPGARSEGTVATVSESMRLELAKFGVRVETITSGRAFPPSLTADAIFHRVTKGRVDAPIPGASPVQRSRRDVPSRPVRPVGSTRLGPGESRMPASGRQS